MLCFVLLIGTAMVGAAAVNMPDAIGDTTKLKVPFAFFSEVILIFPLAQLKECFYGQKKYLYWGTPEALFVLR